ncbi:hypothetical protein GEMRC1_008105 [Eukaryota sp. GEM-RC1]
MSTYRTKTISFCDKSRTIVFQNENGPCPLLALCNYLSLTSKINIVPDNFKTVTHTYLIELIASRIDRVKPNDENEAHQLEEALNLLPSLSVGLDVNPGFHSIFSFEFCQELTVFDVLKIPLVHGWLIDPEDEVLNNYRSLTYNVAVEKSISDSDVVLGGVFN